MLGLSFLNSVFLVGLVSAAIPVIIHLLNRRRIRRIKFSSLEFLEEQSRRRMRKINLRRLIILALRTLAVLLLVMAFARPSVRGAFFLPGKAARNVIVCLDASYSMGVDREEGTAFTAAREIARRVVDEAGDEDLINLIVFSDRAEPTLERGTRNHALVRGAIERAQLSAEGTSIARAIDHALTLIADSDLEGGDIYVVSDFRYNTDSTLVDPELIPDDTRLYLLPVYETDADNVSIDRVLVPRKLLRPGEVIRVGVAVTNHSLITPANFPLELTVDGSRKSEKVLSLAPGASQTVTFPISFTRWGSYHCTVSKNRDRLPIDDDRYFLLEVSRSVPVTIVRGRRQLSDGGASAAAGYFYLEKALNPRATGEGEFAVTVIDEKDVTRSALPARGVVVWVDPQRLESRRLALLERYVRRGGGLMVFLGGSDRRLWQERQVRSFLGLKSATERASNVLTGYTSFQQDHPVFNIFSEDELKLLSRTRVRSYISASGVAPDSVLAYVGSGDPAVWEVSRGRGRILVFAAAPDLESGDIPLSPMFLPLVHTSVSYLASAGIAGRHRDNPAGEQLFFDTPGTSLSSQSLVIRGPDGEPLRPVSFELPTGDTQVICERPQRVGFYRLMRDTTVVAEAAVNVNTVESNLSASSLPDGQRYASVVETGGDLTRNLQEARQGREVFAMFVFLAMTALATESVLGRKA